MDRSKFRGRAYDEKTWIYGSLAMSEDGYCYITGDLTVVDGSLIPVTATEVVPKTVGQYTGLKDKDGVSIFEGDIVLIHGEEEFDSGFHVVWNNNAIVKWSKKECCYYLDVIYKYDIAVTEYGSYRYDTFPLRKWSEDEWWIEYKVLGNTYDNPELMEAK